jgi:hypothetical protein
MNAQSKVVIVVSIPAIHKSRQIDVNSSILQSFSFDDSSLLLLREVGDLTGLLLLLLHLPQVSIDEVTRFVARRYRILFVIFDGCLQGFYY